MTKTFIDRTHGVSDNFLAYTAGFIDGDGCITLTKKSSLGSSGKRHVAVVPLIVVTNTNLKIIKLLHKIFGGYINKHNLSKNTVRKYYEGPGFNYKFRKTIYHLEIQYQQALFLAKAIYPYLVIKKAQVAVLFDYEQLLLQGKLWGMKSIKHKQLGKFKLRLKDKMHKLNHRGVPK
jgi:hypothetical protein